MRNRPWKSFPISPKKNERKTSFAPNGEQIEETHGIGASLQRSSPGVYVQAVRRWLPLTILRRLFGETYEKDILIISSTRVFPFGIRRWEASQSARSTHALPSKFILEERTELG